MPAGPRRSGWRCRWRPTGRMPLPIVSWRASLDFGSSRGNDGASVCRKTCFGKVKGVARKRVSTDILPSVTSAPFDLFWLFRNSQAFGGHRPGSDLDWSCLLTDQFRDPPVLARRTPIPGSPLATPRTIRALKLRPRRSIVSPPAHLHCRICCKPPAQTALSRPYLGRLPWRCL